MTFIRETAASPTAKALAAIVATALIGLVAVAWAQNRAVNHVTAYFHNTTGMYVGDRV